MDRAEYRVLMIKNTTDAANQKFEGPAKNEIVWY
jgi:hypothetical protein